MDLWESGIQFNSAATSVFKEIGIEIRLVAHIVGKGFYICVLSFKVIHSEFIISELCYKQFIQHYILVSLSSKFDY